MGGCPNVLESVGAGEQSSFSRSWFCGLPEIIPDVSMNMTVVILESARCPSWSCTDIRGIDTIFHVSVKMTEFFNG
jgi:hypothetical protein